jgi:hypothetical protein
MQLALGILLCGGIGFALVSLGWRLDAGPAAHVLKAFLAVGLGLGAFSVLYVLQRVLGGETLWAIDALALALPLIGLFQIRRRAGGAGVVASADVDLPRWLGRFLYVTFGLAVGAALYCAVRRAIAYPNGDGWDAFAIWNLHSRFLFRGGAAWRDGFSPLIPWSHPDYPLLVPAAIAHFWTYLGHESHTVPAMIALVFTISTAGLLFAALMILRGRNVAMLGCMALLATPFFIEQGTSQYADVPLSFFLLAAIVLVCLREASASSRATGLMALAGVACSFAAWTKNEGLLFVFALLAARFLVAADDRRRGRDGGTQKRTSFVPFVLAALPVILLILWFKHFVAPSGDLFGSEAVMLRKFLSVSPYGAISRWFAKQFLRFGHWLWIPGTLLVAWLYLALRRPVGIDGGRVEPPCDSRSGIGATGVIALGITLAGYFFVYVITPYDVYWHLRFSLNRLFLQLWPTTIFLCFLTLSAMRKQAAVRPASQNES